MPTHLLNGPAFEERRRNIGASRDELGARAGGISPSTIRRFERGVCRPHRSTVSALLGALDAMAVLHDEQRPGGDQGAAEVSADDSGPAPVPTA